jgi:hypothetical protein
MHHTVKAQTESNLKRAKFPESVGCPVVRLWNAEAGEEAIAQEVLSFSRPPPPSPPLAGGGESNCASGRGVRLSQMRVLSEGERESQHLRYVFFVR